MYNDGHSIVFNASALSSWQRDKSKDDMQTESNFISSDGQQQKVNSSSVRSKRFLNFEGLFNLKDETLTTDSNSEMATRTIENLASVASTGGANLLETLSDSVQLSISQNEPNGDSLALGGSSAIQQQADDSSITSGSEDENPKSFLYSQLANANKRVDFSGAGLSYSYSFESFNLRFGSVSGDNSVGGSEHKINGRHFEAELQLFAYNSILFKSYEEAIGKPSGLLAISILIDLTPNKKQNPSEAKETRHRVENLELNHLVAVITKRLLYRDSQVLVRSLNVSNLLPELNDYVTYDGSLTTPGCQESVTWLILNRPLYLAAEKVSNYWRIVLMSNMRANVPPSS